MAPRRLTRDAQSYYKHAPAQQGTVNMNARVLVVEDHDLVRSAIEVALSDAGFIVATACHGDDGLEKFQSFHPDLVLTDVMMPHKDGIEMMRAIRELKPQAKVLAMSGYRAGSIDFLSMLQRLGANDVIAKPFDADDLISKVSGCLAAAA
jgi:DNA-binding response OmpR family regulator